MDADADDVGEGFLAEATSFAVGAQVAAFYDPLESWFDKSWRPGDIQPA